MGAHAIPGRTGAATRRWPQLAPWRHLDGGLIAATLAVAALGLVMILSATRTGMEGAGLDPFTYLKRQGLFVVVGLVVMVAVTLVDYRVYRDFAQVAYVGALGVLVLVLSPLGAEVNGAQSWFAMGAFQLQPAELTKVVVIVSLASYVAAQRGELDGERFGTCLAMVAVPVVLILLQPDLGTTLVFAAILVAVVVVGGARPRHLAIAAVLGGVVVLGVLQSGWIEGYQRDRLTVFVGARGDGQQAAYQLDQSKTAIGAGGLTGAGLFEGTQTKLRYVPEQQTDFIFTVVGEELGFLGSSTVLALYAFIAWRFWRAAQVARDHLGTLICVGALAMVVGQIFQNIGMAVGIMPISGIPLPFLSYGGSSMITMFAVTGLILNVHMRRFS
ncbi:MAG: rod shape-determining protein RodA [Acidimicrobiales bacterium]